MKGKQVGKIVLAYAIQIICLIISKIVRRKRKIHLHTLSRLPAHLETKIGCCNCIPKTESVTVTTFSGDSLALILLGESSIGIATRLFPSLGPALLMSMGYIDLGKWAAAVDGGTRFGQDLLLLVLALNCIAILCHYLAARISVVTGKNLVQICNEEYDGPTCILLGIQAELSVVVSDLNVVLGIAYGLNLLFGLDMFVCVLLSAIDVLLCPLFIAFKDKCNMEKFVMSITSFALLFYVLGILISQPEIPLQQHRPQNVSIGTLCHGHFLAIIFVFSGIFLVNYVVILSAASIFQGSVLTFQDMLWLNNQGTKKAQKEMMEVATKIFQSPIAPFAFFVVLFSSSQVMGLTWILGGQVLLHDFFGFDPPFWLHRLIVKALAIIPALLCAWNSGAEGVYQLLLFSQVILAMLLPPSVIPLFRVASSRFIMGTFKTSSFVEILMLSAFLWMLASNIIFIAEMLFGDSDWMGNLGWYTGTSVTVPYIFLILTGFASLGLMLWLAATPLKSATNRLNIQSWGLDLQEHFHGSFKEREETLHVSFEEREETDLASNRDDGEEGHLSEKEASEESVVIPSDSSVEFNLIPTETKRPSDHKPPQSNDGVSHTPVSTSQTLDPEESTSSIELPSAEMVDEACAGRLSDESTLTRTEPKDLDTVEEELEGSVQTVAKNDAEADVWEPERPPIGIPEGMATPACEGPGSFRTIGGKSEDGGGSGSLSKLSGLGRAARRQLAGILDEFWGQLYDFHGQVTPEAKAKGIDTILGMAPKPIAAPVTVDAALAGYALKNFPEAERGSTFLNLRDYESPRQTRIPGSFESSYMVSKDSLSWSSYIQSLDAYAKNSCSNALDAGERRYSSLRIPSYSDDRDNQPATIHGYQIASYLSRIAVERPNISLGSSSPAKSTSINPTYRDPPGYSLGQNGLVSLHASSMQSPPVSVTSRLQPERPYYDYSLVGGSENVGSSASPKKYHSLPDISGLTVSSRQAFSANRNSQWSSSIGPEPSVGRTPYERSLYASTASRAAGVPMAVDELSPSKIYRDQFPLPPSSSLNSKSIWSKQPFEQLFGVADKPQSVAREGVQQGTISFAETEAKLLQSFRYCIMKLLKLEGADWLFRQNGGSDEELIDRVAMREKLLCEAEARVVSQVHTIDSSYTSSDWNSSLRNEELGLAHYLVCGEGCIWQVGLIVSFGVWCIRRILELSVMESRPELWGKYTYVLNRLQGVLDLAFFRPRPCMSPCFCLQVKSMSIERFGPPLPDGSLPTSMKAGQGKLTTTSMLLDLIKDVEAAVAGRKGRTGTAAGDVAFPKGKENLASVLKRYKLEHTKAGTVLTRFQHLPTLSPPIETHEKDLYQDRKIDSSLECCPVHDKAASCSCTHIYAQHLSAEEENEDGVSSVRMDRYGLEGRRKEPSSMLNLHVAYSSAFSWQLKIIQPHPTCEAKKQSSRAGIGVGAGFPRFEPREFPKPIDLDRSLRSSAAKFSKKISDQRP
ncbi:Ethylene-insensitive protein 2 [Asimina triloba]